MIKLNYTELTKEKLQYISDFLELNTSWSIEYLIDKFYNQLFDWEYQWIMSYKIIKTKVWLRLKQLPFWWSYISKKIKQLYNINISENDIYELKNKLWNSKISNEKLEILLKIRNEIN